jgi:hypothetical protein
MKTEGATVYVLDAWDDDEQESYVRVFSSNEKAKRHLEQWTETRKGHEIYAGIVKRKVL